MSATEIFEKVQELSPSELVALREQIDEMLEDIEDVAAAQAAKAKGDFTPWENAKKEIVAAWA